MRILVVEDDAARATYFIERFGKYSLIITENADDAILYLSNDVFDIIFLDHDLGDNNGCGADVIAFLYSNPQNLNNNSRIIIHSWNMPAVEAMLSLLPQAYFFPYNSEEFLSIDT